MSLRWLYTPIASLAIGCVLALGCSGPAASTKATAKRREPAPPPFPSEFTPLPPLPASPPSQPGQLGLDYLQSIHPPIGEAWATFLEDCRLRLPPDHPLNRMELEGRVALYLRRDGSLSSLKMVAPSGLQEFDGVVMEIVREAAPYPEPPPELVSDDDLVHVTWLFARDRRQAGPATAEIAVIEWEPERSIPKLLGLGNITTAAARLVKATKGGSAEGQVKLGRMIAEAAIREALRSEDIAVQRAAVAAASDAKVLSATPELRAIVGNTADPELRRAALLSLAKVGAKEAVPFLLDVMKSVKGGGASADSSAAAATALAELGNIESARQVVQGWLSAGDAASIGAALVVMSELPVPEAAPALIAMVGGGQNGSGESRSIRQAACLALGTSLVGRADAKTVNTILAYAADADAAIRASCVAGMARAAKMGLRSRRIFWATVEMIKKDRDERVRAAAVETAAHLEPQRFGKELYMLARERSSLVLMAGARALAVVKGPEATAKLAAWSLTRHEGAEAQAALRKLLDDKNSVIRSAALSKANDVELLSRYAGEPDPVLRSAALARLTRLRGQIGTLPMMAEGIVATAPKSAERAQWASGWLQPEPR